VCSWYAAFPLEFFVIPLSTFCQLPAGLPSPSCAVIWNPCFVLVDPVKATFTAWADPGTNVRGAAIPKPAGPESSAKLLWQVVQLLSNGAFVLPSAFLDHGEGLVDGALRLEVAQQDHVVGQKTHVDRRRPIRTKNTMLGEGKERDDSATV
jgi:hypothetical protein